MQKVVERQPQPSDSRVGHETVHKAACTRIPNAVGRQTDVIMEYSRHAFMCTCICMCTMYNWKYVFMCVFMYVCIQERDILIFLYACMFE